MKRIKFYIVLLLFAVVALLTIGCSRTTSSKNIESDETNNYRRIELVDDLRAYTKPIRFDDCLYMITSPSATEIQYQITSVDTLESSIYSLNCPISTTPLDFALTSNYYYILANENQESLFPSIYIIDKEGIAKDIIPVTLYFPNINYRDVISLCAANDKLYVAVDRTVISLSDLSFSSIDWSIDIPYVVTDLFYEKHLYTVGHNGSSYSINTYSSNGKPLESSFQELSTYPLQNIFFDTSCFFFIGEDFLYVYHLDDGTFNKILKLSEVGFLPNTVYSVHSDLNNNLLVYGYDILSKNEILWKLEELAPNEFEKRTIINISYIEDGTSSVPSAVIKFNAIQTQYQALCTEYTDDVDELFSSFDSAVVTGKIGDVIILPNNFEFADYANIGLFADLNEFISSDESFSKDTIFNCVLDYFSLDGQLLALTPAFTINSVVGKKSNFDNAIWNLQKLVDFDQTNSPTRLFGRKYTRLDATNTYLPFISSDCIAGTTCNFQNSDFITLIEYLKLLPTESHEADMSDNFSLYQNNEILLYEPMVFGSFFDYFALMARFGANEELVFLGYPSTSGGISKLNPQKIIAISSQSTNKNGAWEFIKFMLSSTNLIDDTKGMQAIPSSRNVLNDWLDSEQQLYYIFSQKSPDYKIFINKHDIPDNINGVLFEVDSTVVSEFMSIVDSITVKPPISSKILNIIQEELNAYFATNALPTNVASIIQNRVSIYLSEHQ